MADLSTEDMIAMGMFHSKDYGTPLPVDYMLNKELLKSAPEKIQRNIRSRKILFLFLAITIVCLICFISIYRFA
jgi:hypothetical protein